MRRKNLKCLAVILSGIFTSSAWASCNFNWQSYGDNSIKNLVAQEIGSHVPDDFCRYAKSHEIVFTFDAFTLGKGCVGYASAGLRKRGSKTMIIKRSSAVVSNTECSGSPQAVKMAAESALDAVDQVMNNLPSHIKAANELN